MLLVVASLSGNTRELARMIAACCRQAGHRVQWQEADDAAASMRAAARADLVLLGSWTDNAGRTPAEMKQWVVRLAAAGCRPREVAVFGTGETQWGQEYYCGAVHRLIRHFGSPHAGLMIEQMPHAASDAQAVSDWTTAVLATCRRNAHADH